MARSIKANVPTKATMYNNMMKMMKMNLLENGEQEGSGYINPWIKAAISDTSALEEPQLTFHVIEQRQAGSGNAQHPIG